MAAYEESLVRLSVEASADLSASQYRYMVVNASGQLAAASAGAKADGILQDKPAAAGRAGSLGISGVSKVEAGAAFTAGDDLAVGTSGKAVLATTGDIVVGRAMEDATGDGSIVPTRIVMAPEPLA